MFEGQRKAGGRLAQDQLVRNVIQCDGPIRFRRRCTISSSPARSKQTGRGELPWLAEWAAEVSIDLVGEFVERDFPLRGHEQAYNGNDVTKDKRDTTDDSTVVFPLFPVSGEVLRG
eukprot:GDKH01020151.1.p3 GENE.GDKH01020151.1~~GDKH01020151.1.p3  ORF type:complete len:116 (+),score=9.56 GDKH01020151.1:265-612(+)